MKNILLILLAFALPAFANAQTNKTKALALLDSLKTTLNQQAPNSFIFGIDSLPTNMSLPKGGSGFLMHTRAGNGGDSCICTCYCALKTENKGLLIFRLTSIKNITIEKDKGMLNLYQLNTETPATIKIDNPKKLAKVKSWFDGLADYCRKN